MRQAISTKYYGPTNTRESRIVAKCLAGKVSINYSHELDSDGNHHAAAEKLIRKLGWSGQWQGGGVDGGYVFVCLDNDLFTVTI